MARKTKQDLINDLNSEHYLTRFQYFLQNSIDPRRKQGQRYSLEVIIIVALLASICGADDAQAFESWGKSHEDWLETFLDLPYGTPTQDVFLRFFASFDPEQFSNIYSNWIKALLKIMPLKTGDGHIAIDGKALRRSSNDYKEGKLVHTVSAWSTMQGFVLGQVDCDWKSNEMKAIPKLLKKLDLRKSTVTIDAGGIYEEVIDEVVENNGHYIIAVKKNQPKLYEDITKTFLPENTTNDRNDYLFFESKDKGHGRTEVRKYTVCKNTSFIQNKSKWNSVSCVIAVQSIRTINKTKQTSEFTRYFISNHKDLSAEKIATFIRNHWGIENGLHWVLDMAFNEDQARHRSKNCAKNLAIVRHFAITLLKNEKTQKLGISNKRKLAGWNFDYLLKVLLTPREN